MTYDEHVVEKWNAIQEEFLVSADSLRKAMASIFTTPLMGENTCKEEMNMENENVKTTSELLEEQIRTTLDDLDLIRLGGDHEAQKALLERLKVLAEERLAIEKFETDTAIKIRELESREKREKKEQELEAEKVKEQKKENVINAVLGSVTAATGLGSIWATLHCFKKGIKFEETGSYTTRTGQSVGSILGLFRRK